MCFLKNVVIVLCVFGVCSIVLKWCVFLVICVGVVMLFVFFSSVFVICSDVVGNVVSFVVCFVVNVLSLVVGSMWLMMLIWCVFSVLNGLFSSSFLVVI